jgi:DNA-binding response OmpR family regulator
MKLLIADDNQQIRNIIASYAQREGYELLFAEDGHEALNKADEADVILLDVMMPKLDGFSVCKEIRKHSSVPILMVTARGEDYERIMGLEIGADDYIVKPFSPAELMARIKAILRRLEPRETSMEVKFDNLSVNLDTYQVHIDEQVIHLTKKEIELLYLLCAHPERAYTREQLLNQVWGYDYYGDTRTVDSHIKRLRAKLDVQNHPTWQIQTVWGIGYKFERVQAK